MGLTNRLKQKARLGAVFGGFIGEGNIDLIRMRKNYDIYYNGF
jgi:hypothetical protein